MPREYVAVFLQDPELDAPDEILGEPDSGVVPPEALPTTAQLAEDPDIKDVVAAAKQLLDPVA